jgi:hypothetical protein
MVEILLVVIAILLAVVAIAVVSALRGGLALKLDDATRHLREAASHYGDVNAVAEMVRQLRSDPKLMEDLAAYPRQVVMAALVHRVNTIGRDLEAAESELSRKRYLLGHYGDHHQSAVDRLEQLVEHLLEQLTETEAVATEFNSPHLVS